MEDNGYKNGDDLSGKMFPTLFEAKLTSSFIQTGS